MTRVRIINRYDMEGVTAEAYQQARNMIFAGFNVDFVYDETIAIEDNVKHFAMEYLPGQYDQRADSAAQCIQILTQGEPPTIQTAKIILLYGSLTEDDFRKIKAYCINTVDSREAAWEKPVSLALPTTVPEDVAVLTGFIQMDDAQLSRFKQKMGFVMSDADFKFCQTYFRDEEKRDPTVTEMTVIDTYWSDHCRHTTFLTTIDQVSIEAEGLGRLCAGL